MLRLEEQLAVLVAEETYAQSLFIGRDACLAHRRSLVSDVAWVPTGDAMVWAFFRDVREVEGPSVQDREARLEQLFPSGLTLAGKERAQQILEEGFRYNLGRRRSVNSPTVALSFLHSRNRAPLRLSPRRPGREGARRDLEAALRRAGAPHPHAKTSRGEDVPARGLLWIEEGTRSARGQPARDEPAGARSGSRSRAVYAPDERLGVWLPREMREAYGNRSRSAGQEVQGVARYTAWRRAQVEVQFVVPAP